MNRFRVIHKYSFHNYKPASEYYIKNVGYILVLAAMTVLNLWIGRVFFVGRGWLSVVVHGLIVVATVPTAFVAIYWRGHECRYLVSLGKNIFNRLRRK